MLIKSIQDPSVIRTRGLLYVLTAYTCSARDLLLEKSWKRQNDAIKGFNMGSKLPPNVKAYNKISVFTQKVSETHQLSGTEARHMLFAAFQYTSRDWLTDNTESPRTTSQYFSKWSIQRDYKILATFESLIYRILKDVGQSALYWTNAQLKKF